MGYAGTVSKSQATILIVEDHDALRDSLKTWLSSIFQDCILLQAKTGEEALELSRAHQPKIVLMDIMLPAMSGIETTRHIKGVVPDAQVVMLSIYAKNTKVNLSQAERNELKTLVPELVREFMKGGHS